MKIKIEFTYHQLCRLNEIWNFNTPNPMILNRHEKVNYFMLEHLSKKFISKQDTLRFNHKPKNKYSISLAFYEAHYLENFLCISILLCDSDYEKKAIVQRYSDEINQKLT